MDDAAQQRTAVPSPATETYLAHRRWLLALVLVVVAFAAYQPAWRASFIGFDDYSHVTENRALQSLDGLGRIWVKPGTTPQYYPLVFTTFWVEYHVWKLQPFGYHLVNILLHGLTAVLLWFVLRRLEIPGSWWAAAVFALHPVCVESVAWITELKNTQSGVLFFLTILCFLRFRPLNARDAAPVCDWRYYFLTLVFFLCALLSKTATCPLPAVLALLIWWKTGRFGKRDALELAPLFVAGIASGFMTIWVEKQYGGVSGAEWSLSLAQRCLVAGRALWFYAGKLFWPRNFTFVYPRWDIDTSVAWQYLFPVAALAVVIALWLLRSRIGRGSLVAVLCFVSLLAPVLDFVNGYFFRYSYVADHFQYLACPALIALAASTGTVICERAGQWGRNLGTLAAASILLILGMGTWRQARVYQDFETLWGDTLTKNPRCWMAHLMLGNAFLREGKLNDANGQYAQALRIKPDYAEAHANLGFVLLQMGRIQDAIEHYQQALRIKPDYAEGHNGLGFVLNQLGRRPEAMEHWEQALRIRPNYAEAQNSLAWSLATRVPAEGGDPVRAVALAEQACKLTDNRVASYLDTLAAAYAAAGRFDDAVGMAQKAIPLADSTAQTQLVSRVEMRLKLYRLNHAYYGPENVTDSRNP